MAAHMPFAYSPSLATLTDGLNSVLTGAATSPVGVSIIDRRPLDTTQSHPSEVVRCRTASGTELQLLCKYAGRPPGTKHEAHGHRRGVPYEAMVYERILVPARAKVPPFYGTHVDPEGTLWLVLGYLEGGVPVSGAALEPAAPEKAAQWIAQFQSTVEARTEQNARASLITYDADYYNGWARRTLAFSESIEMVQPWLGRVVEKYIESVVPMLLDHPTVIHGELYPGNTLVWDGGVYVLDWESAAIGAAEIDLVCLTDGWPTAVARRMVGAYRRERGLKAAALKVALDAARLYLRFRWLGDRPHWTTSPAAPRRFARLRSAAERLGLL